MPDDTIIIKAPAGTKARWVRQSQRAGVKLSDWLIERVEAQPMKKLVAIVIPADVPFSELNLARDADGSVSFDWRPIKRLCEASGIDVALLRDSPEDNLAAVLTTWYRQHLADLREQFSRRAEAPSEADEDRQVTKFLKRTSLEQVEQYARGVR